MMCVKILQFGGRISWIVGCRLWVVSWGKREGKVEKSLLDRWALHGLSSVVVATYYGFDGVQWSWYRLDIREDQPYETA